LYLLSFLSKISLIKTL